MLFIIKLFKLLLLVSTLSCIYSCSQKNENEFSKYQTSNYTNEYELCVADTISVYQKDTNYIASVGNMTTWKNYFLIEDRSLCKIWVLDSNFKKITSLGKRGKGPDEFANPALSAISLNDKLFIFDIVSRKANVYDNNFVFSHSLNLPANVSPKTGTGISLNSNLILLPATIWDKKTKQKAIENPDEFRRTVTTIAIIDTGLKNINNVYKLEDEFFSNESKWYYQTFAETPTLCKGIGDTFFAQHWGSYKINQFNEKYELMQQFGRMPKNFRTIPKDASLPPADQGTDKRYTQSSFFGQNGFDEINDLYCVEYMSLTVEGWEQSNPLLYKMYLQVYNKNYDCVLDEPLPGPLRLVHKGKLYVLIEDSPEKIRFIVYTLRKKNNS